MSRDIVFNTVGIVSDVFPEVIDIDDTPLPEGYNYISLDRAEKWHKKYGVLKTIKYYTIDYIAVGESAFGKKADRISFKSYDNGGTYYLGDEKLGYLSGEELKRHEYKTEIKAYIYCYDNQNYTEDAYILGEVEEGEVSESYILELMSKCVDDYCSYYAETLSVLVKTLLDIKKGKTVVLEVY